MKVAIDAIPLSVSTGGITRYTAELAAALQQEFPEHTFTLLHPAADNWFMRRWWSCGLPLTLLRQQFDLFHGTDFAVPYLPVKPSVLTLHDLSPFLPDSPGPSRRVRRRTPFLLGLGLAGMVITPTEAVRKQAIHRFRIHPDCIVAVHLAASDHFHPIEVQAPSTPYFLFLGTLEPRKNVHTIIHAWRNVRVTHPVDLILAGRRREDFLPLPHEPGLRVLGAVSESDLPRLYSAAAAVLFPSHYEGFGLPVLEAMQCGAPVIASRDPAVMEVSGSAALTVPATAVDQWTQAMTAILDNGALRQELRTAGLRRAAAFTWCDTARNTMEVYREARRRFEA
jgi:glycosyltransferase involved in cell wall biosynthesis